MRISAETKRKLEVFFRRHFDDPELNLPEIEIYVGRAARAATGFLQIGGITVGRRVIVHPAHIFRRSDGRLSVSKNLLAHEVVHVLQYQKEGFLGFLAAYLKDYWRNLKTKKKWNAVSRFEAYYQISYEKQAREAAAAFEAEFNV